MNGAMSQRDRTLRVRENQRRRAAGVDPLPRGLWPADFPSVAERRNNAKAQGMATTARAAATAAAAVVAAAIRRSGADASGADASGTGASGPGSSGAGASGAGSSGMDNGRIYFDETNVRASVRHLGLEDAAITGADAMGIIESEGISVSPESMHAMLSHLMQLGYE